MLNDFLTEAELSSPLFFLSTFLAIDSGGIFQSLFEARKSDIFIRVTRIFSKLVQFMQQNQLLQANT